MSFQHFFVILVEFDKSETSRLNKFGPKNGQQIFFLNGPIQRENWLVGGLIFLRTRFSKGNNFFFSFFQGYLSLSDASVSAPNSCLTFSYVKVYQYFNAVYISGMQA